MSQSDVEMNLTQEPLQVEEDHHSDQFALFHWNSDNHTCYNASLEIDEFYRERRTIFVYYKVMCVLPLINALLNLIATLVFTRRKPYTLLTKLLLGLTVAEVVFQLSMGVNQVMILQMESGRLVGQSETSTKLLSLFFAFTVVIVTGGHIARNWLVALIATMRYEVVCRTVGQRVVFRTLEVRRLMILVASLSTIVALPRFAEFQFYLCSTKNQVVFMEGLLLNYPVYFYGYSGVVLLIFQSFCPVLIVCVVSCFLLNVIYRRQRIRSNLRLNIAATTSPPRRSLRSCDFLIGLLCLAFFICETPGCLKIIDKMNHSLQELGWFMNIMPCLDSTFNFVIYVITNNIFRTNCLPTLPSCFREMPDPDGDAVGGRGRRGRARDAQNGATADGASETHLTPRNLGQSKVNQRLTTRDAMVHRGCSDYDQGNTHLQIELERLHPKKPLNSTMC